MNQDLGALSGSRASTEPSSTVSALTGVDPARKEKWAAFDARYEEWRQKKLAPAFIQQTGAHSWQIQYLIHAKPPKRSWLYRLLNDPPIRALAEPYYNGWPGDHRGWMIFETKEAARDFYQFSNGFMDFEEYRHLPREPWAPSEHIDLDERGNFAIAIEAAEAGETSTEIERPTEGESAGRNGIAQGPSQ